MIEIRNQTMKRIIVILLCFLVFTACKSKKPATTASANNIEEAIQQTGEEVGYNKSQTSKDSIFVQIQRTPCFGRCGIYTATIYNDGKVRYIGEKWVEKEGVYEGKVSQDVMNKILSYANDIKYFEMDSEYDNKSVTDLPSTITWVRNNESLKTVANRYGGPKELSDFEKYLDTLFNSMDLEKVSDK